MTSGKSDLIDVVVELKMDDPAKKAIAVSQGEIDEDNGREIWIWLPRSLIEYEAGEGDTVTVTLPEWLAQEKELI